MQWHYSPLLGSRPIETCTVAESLTEPEYALPGPWLSCTMSKPPTSWSFDIAGRPPISCYFPALSTERGVPAKLGRTAA